MTPDFSLPTISVLPEPEPFSESGAFWYEKYSSSPTKSPPNLPSVFPAFFNKILLDAPCSGEGMFRKEEALARDWTPEKSAELSDIQKDLVLKAADMLRPGGMLLYSTCTFFPM